MTNPEGGTSRGAGFSGARLVVLLLGAVAAVVGSVLAGFALFEPASAPCATGDMAANEFVDGRYVPRMETFDTVEDAEAFICHDVPELTTQGWALQTITAERTVSIERLVEGNGVGIVTLAYENVATGRTLTLEAAPYFGASYFESELPDQRTEEDVQVASRDATAYRYGINPDQVEVLWFEETLEHRAVTQTDTDFTLQSLMQLLEALE